VHVALHLLKTGIVCSCDTGVWSWHILLWRCPVVTRGGFPQQNQSPPPYSDSKLHRCHHFWRWVSLGKVEKSHELGDFVQDQVSFAVSTGLAYPLVSPPSSTILFHVSICIHWRRGPMRPCPTSPTGLYSPNESPNPAQNPSGFLPSVLPSALTEGQIARGGDITNDPSWIELTRSEVTV
jgi:hypothetical protein